MDVEVYCPWKQQPHCDSCRFSTTFINMISPIPGKADSLKPHSHQMYHRTAASHAGSVQTSEYSFQSRAAIPKPASFRHRFKRPSASVARSLYEVDSQWASQNNLDTSQRPVTSSSKKSFPRTAKRKVSRDAIASDSDGRENRHQAALPRFRRRKHLEARSYSTCLDGAAVGIPLLVEARGVSKVRRA